MAIKKEKLLPNGVSGNYWKITNETYDKLSLRAQWIIELFKDKESSSSGKSLGIKKTFSAYVSKESLSADRTALGYIIIKEQAAKMLPQLFGKITQGLTPYDSDLIDGEDV
jgi:hypothetical protein